jgi:hypothetical protein
VTCTAEARSCHQNASLAGGRGARCESLGNGWTTRPAAAIACTHSAVALLTGAHATTQGASPSREGGRDALSWPAEVSVKSAACKEAVAVFPGEEGVDRIKAIALCELQ